MGTAAQIYFPTWLLAARLEGNQAVESSADINDLDDVRQALAGNDRAYERIVTRHQQAVAAWMWRFTRDRVELEELTQEVFVQAWLSLKSFRGASELRTWLLAIATRVGYTHWKRRAREQKRGEAVRAALDPAPETESPSAAADALYAVLGELPAKERTVLTLMYFEELGVAEIARLTGWSVSLVKVRAYRARKRLKALLERDGFGR